MLLCLPLVVPVPKVIQILCIKANDNVVVADFLSLHISAKVKWGYKNVWGTVWYAWNEPLV